jgi:hypothetical protein
LSSSTKSIVNPLTRLQTALAEVRALIDRIPLIARIVLCIALIGLELFVSRTSLQSGRTLTTFDGGYFPASFGSVAEIATERAGPVTVYSGNLTVGNFPAGCDGTPCTLHVLGDATYSVHGQVGLINVSISEPAQAVPTAFSGALLLLACLIAFLAIPAPAAISPKAALPHWRPGAIAAGAALVAALLFPPYLHNDQLGHGVIGDWGYLGWGYVDTISSSLNAVGSSGGDFAELPSDGKTIVLPTIVGVLGGWFSPTAAGYFWSLVLTALTAAGIAMLATLLWQDELPGVVAGALYAVEPMTVGYALSFYQELGFAAFFTWGVFLAITAVRRGSGRRMIAGAVLVALAVCSKSPVLAIEAVFLTFALFVAFGVGLRLSAGVAAGFGALSLLAAVATWPFLWINTLQRVAFAFGARIIVDQTIHQSAPLASRVFNAVTQTAIHTGPICLLLLVASVVFLARERRWTVLFGLLGAIAVGIALVVPTSFYLEHYWFYTIPALPLLASVAIVPLSRIVASRAAGEPLRRVRAVAVALVGAELVWALIFWPYPSSATIGCFTLRCSADRWGVSEPTYGLREAAAWIRDHTPESAAIGALTAPHILQDQVGNRFVRSLWMPPDSATQRRLLFTSGVQYVVGNVWSKLADDVPATDVIVAWAGPSRYGSPVVYAVRKPTRPWLWPDAPPWDAARTLIPAEASQVVAFPRRAGYLGSVPARRLVTPPQPQRTSPPTVSAIMQIGGGVLLVQGAAALAPALDLASPLATDSTGDGVIALPSIDSLEPTRRVKLHPIGSPYPGDHRFAAVLSPNKDAYALKYLYVRVHATTPTQSFGQMNGNVGLSCSFGATTAQELTVISSYDSVAWIPMDAGNVGRCDPTRQRITVAADVFVPHASSIEIVATPEIDGTVARQLLGPDADAKLLSQMTPQQAASVAARDGTSPAGIVVPLDSHGYDAVASERIALGSHAAFLAFLREPPGKAIQPIPDVYCKNACVYDAAARSYAVAANGRIIWAWSLDSLARLHLMRVDLSDVRPGLKGASAGVFLSYGAKSCYTDLRDFARNGFLYLNLDALRAGACAGLSGGRLGLTVFPRSAIVVNGVPQAYVAGQ